MSCIDTEARACAARGRLYRSIPSTLAASTIREVVLWAAHGASKQANVVKMRMVSVLRSR